MDSLTQIVLGAAVGEAVGGKKMGAKAALWGGIAGTIPDLDVFFNRFYPPIEAALVHRGFSHSILFALLFSPIFAWFLHRLYKQKYEYRIWLLLFFFGILTHPILDIFTNYGTSLLWPLPHRFSLDSVFVIDPLYTIPFLICVITAICIKRKSKWRTIINWSGIIYSTLYLIFGLGVKTYIQQQTPLYFTNLEVNKDKILVSAMPVTTFYWMILAEGKDEYYITYQSIFSKHKPKEIEIIPKNHHLLNELQWKKGEEHFPDLLKFISKGYYSIEKKDNVYYFYDLRFGTASKLTNGLVKKPILGFELMVVNNFVEKTDNLRNENSFTNLKFDNYWNNVFAKYE